MDRTWELHELHEERTRNIGGQTTCKVMKGVDLNIATSESWFWW